MTQGGDDYTHSDDDDPRAPPSNGKAKRKGSSRPRPALTVVSPGNGDTGQAWRSGLVLDGKELPRKDAGNAALIFARSPEWRGVVRHDEFADRILVGEMPSWSRAGGLPPVPPGELNDRHATYAGLWLSKRENVSWKKEALREALEYAAHLNGFNPLTEYLDGCASRWDRRPRIAEWLSSYASVERSVYTSSVARMWLISAVARAYKPGAQVDHMLILEGDQGEKKTTLARVLASGVDGAFLAKLPRLSDGERAAFAIQGKWIGEVGELDALRGASATMVKDFLTITEDNFRPPYGRYYVKRGRTIVFVGTTNQHAYLEDETGARRFWPVRVGKIDRDALERDRDQIWGEAVIAFRRGEQWWPTDDLVPVFSAAQDDRYEADGWEDLLQSLLDVGAPVTIGDCFRTLNVGLDSNLDWTKSDQRRIVSILRRAKWTSRNLRIDGVRSRRWHAPGT